MKENLLTEKGLEKLKKELEELKKKNIEIINEISRTKNFGDLSENSEYQNAKISSMINQKKILELEKIIKNCKIIKSSEIKNKNIIEFSAIVELENLENGKITKYKIIGNEEITKITNGISNESPIGKALIGKKKDDIITIKKFNKTNKFKILSIQYE